VYAGLERVGEEKRARNSEVLRFWGRDTAISGLRSCPSYECSVSEGEGALGWIVACMLLERGSLC
jgi:hypothetical protein